MGTLVSITLYADNQDQAQRAFVAAFGRIAQLNRILSDYDPASELSRICEINAPLSEELVTVLTHAQRLATETGGAFDITVGPLSHLWRAARREKRLPSDEEISSALSRSGYQKLQFDPKSRKATCLTSGMQLDAGGIGKGYAADEALAAMTKVGVIRALIAVSGDIVAGDAPPGKPGWKVKIPGKTIDLANAAVSTSGDEFQYLEVNGVRYSHLIDPRTGMALRDARTVTVIAKRGIEADSLTKAIAIGGAEMEKRIRETFSVTVFIQ